MIADGRANLGETNAPVDERLHSRGTVGQGHPQSHSVIAGGKVTRLKCVDQRRIAAQALQHRDDLPMQGGTAPTNDQFKRALIGERHEESGFAAIWFGEQRKGHLRMSLETATRGCGVTLGQSSHIGG